LLKCNVKLLIIRAGWLIQIHNNYKIIKGANIQHKTRDATAVNKSKSINSIKS